LVGAIVIEPVLHVVEVFQSLFPDCLLNVGEVVFFAEPLLELVDHALKFILRLVGLNFILISGFVPSQTSISMTDLLLGQLSISSNWSNVKWNISGLASNGGLGDLDNTGS